MPLSQSVSTEPKKSIKPTNLLKENNQRRFLLKRNNGDVSMELHLPSEGWWLFGMWVKIPIEPLLMMTKRMRTIIIQLDDLWTKIDRGWF
jgi:hypothetical protein